MGVAQKRTVEVPSYEQAQLERSRLRLQGYEVMDELVVADSVRITMVKKKQLNVPLLVVSLLLWILPGLIYLMVHSARSDEVVEILVVAPRAEPTAALAPAAQEPVLHMSPDRQEWWDGTTWRAVSVSVPPNARRSPDNTSWWDGEEWRPLPGRNTQAG